MSKDKYNRIYDALVKKAQNREKPEGYTERHHIIPKVLGGSDEAQNLVYLTFREHFIAHWLLTKIYPKNIHLKHALRNFCSPKYGQVLNSRQYAKARALFIEAQKALHSTPEWRQQKSTKTKNACRVHKEAYIKGSRNRWHGEAASKNRAQARDARKAANIKDPTITKRQAATLKKTYAENEGLRLKNKETQQRVNGKPIQVFLDNGVSITFPAYKEACRSLGCTHHLSAMANGTPTNKRGIPPQFLRCRTPAYIGLKIIAAKYIKTS